MIDNEDQAANSEKLRIAAKLRLAFDRLAKACDHARRVMIEAQALLESTQDEPTLLRIETAFAHSGGGLDAGSRTVPHWDPQTRTLSVGGLIVKQYRVPSRNQEAVLAAFQEEGWPRRIDDPLPYQPGMKAKYRLHFTIGRLNQGERQPMIRFFGDGTGEGVCWDFSQAPAVSITSAIKSRQVRRRAA